MLNEMNFRNSKNKTFWHVKTQPIENAQYTNGAPIGVSIWVLQKTTLLRLIEKSFKQTIIQGINNKNLTKLL